MSDRPKVTGSSNSPSGMMRRPNYEPPKPEVLPNKRYHERYDDAGSTTGTMPAVTEGADINADIDSDKSNGE